MATRTVVTYDRNGNVVETQTFEVSDEQVYREEVPNRLAAVSATLRTWADDAEAAYAAWPTLTNAQKDARHRETIRRLGVLCDGLADFIMDRGLA